MEKKVVKFKELFLSETARDTGVLFMGNAMSSILAIIFSIAVARALGPTNWGITAGFIGLATVASAIGDFGLGSSLFRFASRLWQIDQKKAKKVINYIFSIRLVSAIGLAVLVIVFANLYGAALSLGKQGNLYVTAAVAVFAYLLFDFAIFSYQAKKEFWKASMNLMMSNLLRIIFFFILHLFSGYTVLNAMIAYALAPFVMAIYNLFLLRVKVVFSLDKIAKDKFVPFAGAMGINRILGVIQGRLDIFFILGLLGAYEAGIFSAAKQLALGVPLVIGSFATVLAPRFASLKKEALFSYFYKTIYLSLALTFGLLIGIFISPLVVGFFGPEYQASTRVLQFLFVAYIPFVLATPAVNLIIYAFGKPAFIAAISLVQLIIVFVTNSLLISSVGVMAAVIALGIANLFQLTFVYSYVFFRLIPEK